MGLAEQVGRVYLVGAGPGDPGLLTLRGQWCLEQADVVLYDYLANPDILAHAPRAETICLGQHGRSNIWPQETIHQRLIEFARQGKTVVRLKGGDPAIFARGAEEVEALARAGVPCEIVPGITAALAASSYAGIPVTHRDHASAVALVTGQERHEHAAGIDYGALAAFPGTLVFYMGVTSAPAWVARLIEAGKPGSTPTALIRRCSLPDQATHFCLLADLPRLIETERIRPPAVIIIGDVVTWGRTWSGHVRPPLFGQRILVTRPREQAEELRGPLRHLGATVWLQPAITVGPPPQWDAVDRAIDDLDRVDWLVFTSSNGVRFFLNRLFERGQDVRRLAGNRLAVVGPGTAATLNEYHLRADLVAEQGVAEGLAESLRDVVRGQRLLWIRASRGRDVLAHMLREELAEWSEVVCYAHTDVTEPDPIIRERMERGEVDWVTVTSSGIARSLARMFGDKLRGCRLASLSPLTTATLRELGYDVGAEAPQPTRDGLIAAILEARREECPRP